MVRTRARILATALVLCVAPICLAGDEPAKDPATDFAALEKQFEDSKTPIKVRYADMRPLFEEFAKSHAGTDPGLDAKLWLLQNTWWIKDDKGSMEDAALRIADEILAEYPNSEHLARIAEWSYVFRKDQFAAYLVKLSAPERPNAVRASAALADAIGVMRSGKKEEAKPLFENVAASFGRLAKGYTTYGALADAYLHPHAAGDLEVGKTAPDIVGSSPDGRAMKLSDFKGRVVVIDFFGDW